MVFGVADTFAGRSDVKIADRNKARTRIISNSSNYVRCILDERKSPEISKTSFYSFNEFKLLFEWTLKNPFFFWIIQVCFHWIVKLILNWVIRKILKLNQISISALTIASHEILTDLNGHVYHHRPKTSWTKFYKGALYWNFDFLQSNMFY